MSPSTPQRIARRLPSGRRCLVSVVLAVSGLACSSPSFPRASQHPLLGQRVPELGARTTVFGNEFDADQLRGHPVFFKFFAEFCLPCKESLPGLQRLHQTNPEVRFVGINEDTRLDDAVHLAREFGLTFPIIPDQKKDISHKFEVSTLPTSFAADTSGVIRWVGTSRRSDKELQRAVAALYQR